ncbi:MAG: ATP-binding protein [Bacteroidetes bacterium]|nr:ATP-binding protein [Bacteroidota bacterium]
MQKIYPFKFLDAYTLDDSQLFFGRNEEVEALYNMVFQSDLLLVYGASGTGKTSLIQCGLASKFATHEWLPLFIRRGTDINQSFEKVLIENGGDIESDSQDLDWLDQDWTSEVENIQSNLSSLAKLFRSIYLKSFKPIYLIFDQFEELYILGSKQEQQKFFQTIKEILQIEQPVKVIFSVREEYLGHLYEFERRVPELLRKKLRVESMTFEKINDIIQGIGNLKQSIVKLENGCEEEFCVKVFQKIKGSENKISIELPYLQVFLDKLYLDITGDEKRETEAVFNVESLNKLGDIGDVLQDFLDEQVSSAAREFNFEREVIWKILSSFVTLDGTKEPLSINEIYSRLSDINQSIIFNAIQYFENRRIIRFSEKEQMFEIAHDSLANQISTRRSNEEIAVLEVSRLIKYQSNLKDNARELLSAKQLAFIEPYLTHLQLTITEKELIEQSYIAAEKERKQTRKRHRRIQMIYVGASVISLFFGMYALFQKREADQNYLELRKNNAESYFKEEKFSQAKSEYADLINTSLNQGRSISKKIVECEYLDSVKKIFDSNINNARILSASGKTEDLLKADSIFNNTIRLNYPSGIQRLTAELELHRRQVIKFCDDNIIIAGTLINYNMNMAALETLQNILKLQKNNAEAHNLLKKIKK